MPFLVGLVASTHAGTHTIEGRKVGVHDGDTITLLDADNRQHKIRLDGIDAPESGQPFGRASKQNLAELLDNREAMAKCSKIDRYRRRVCRVLVCGADAGASRRRIVDIGAVQAAYVAKFGPLPDDSEGGRYFPNPPLKYAVRMGMVQQYLEALQSAIDSGKPFDSSAFVRKCETNQLEWPADPPPTHKEVAARREGQREFWAKVAPPIFGARVSDFSEPKLNWD